ncbi:hypothetical protein WN943_022185 [Citrus x changshan-huyou]
MKQTKVWSSLLSFHGTCVLLLLTLVSMNDGFGVEAVKDFKVGDDFGWQEPGHNNTAMYSQWATRNRFHVGDSLSFEYKNDSVLEVDKWGYYHCNSSNATVAFNNGKSVFKLDRPGPFYFISGTPDHCKNGQRLLVEVMGLHPISQSPPAIAVPPDSYLAPGPLPSSGSLVSVTLLYSVLMSLIIVTIT